MTKSIPTSEKGVKSVTKFGLTTLKTVKEKTIEISEFDYNPAFTDELDKLGGDNSKNRFVYVFPNDENISLRLNEILTFYWCNSKTLTAGQRALRDKINKWFGGEKGITDFFFKKDSYGMGFYDLNECCGTPKEIKKELQAAGIKVSQIRGRRIYVKCD